MPGEKGIGAFAARLAARPKEAIIKLKDVRAKRVEKLHAQGRKTAGEKLQGMIFRGEKRNAKPEATLASIAKRTDLVDAPLLANGQQITEPFGSGTDTATPIEQTALEQAKATSEETPTAIRTSEDTQVHPAASSSDVSTIDLEAVNTSPVLPKVSDDSPLGQAYAERVKIVQTRQAGEEAAKVLENTTLASVSKRAEWRQDVSTNDEFADYNAFRDAQQSPADIKVQLANDTAYQTADNVTKRDMVKQKIGEERQRRADSADQLIQKELDKPDPNGSIKQRLTEMAQNDKNIAAGLERVVASQEAQATLGKLARNEDYTAFHAQKEALLATADNAQGRMDAGEISADELQAIIKDGAEKMAGLEREFIQNHLGTPEGEELLEQIGHVDQSFRDAVVVEKMAKEQAATDGGKQEQKQADDPNTPVVPGSPEAKAAWEKREVEIATATGRVEALEKAVVKDESKAAELSEAKKDLDRLQQGADQLYFDSMTSNELVQEAEGKVKGELKERFTAQQSGIRGWMADVGRNNGANREIERMYKVLEAGKNLDRKVLQDAVKNGSLIGKDTEKYEQDMGIILRRIRWKKGSALKRLPFGIGRFFKNSQDKEEAIAQEQLRALTGELSEDQMKQYDKSMLRLLWNILITTLAITFPVAQDLAAESYSAQTQAN